MPVNRKNTSELFDKDRLPTSLNVRVTPKAKSARITKEITGDNSPYYKVYVTVAPENNKANKAVIELLADALGLPKSALTISHGLTSREKTILIQP